MRDLLVGAVLSIHDGFLYLGLSLDSYFFDLSMVVEHNLVVVFIFNPSLKLPCLVPQSYAVFLYQSR